MNQVIDIFTKKKIERAKYIKLRDKFAKNSEHLILKEVKKFLKELIVRKEFSGKFIGIYWPLKGEVDLRSLKDSFSLSFALPASRKGKIITYHSWYSDELKPDIYGIPAPLHASTLKPQDISTLLVPALAIDKKGKRLGYGGGLFDRLRQSHEWRAIPSFVVIPKCCISQSPLPSNSLDIPFDGWISEDGFTKLL